MRVTDPGKHAGKRRAPAPAPSWTARDLVPLAAGITAAVVAWGYLVYVAIDFGTAARGGEHGAWWLLALATVGAMACLFVGLVLVARLVRKVAGAPQGAADPAPVIRVDPALPTPERRPGGARKAQRRR